MFGTRGERLKRGPRARSRRRDGGIYQPGSERLPCNSRFEVPPRGHGKHGRETDAARSGCSDKLPGSSKKSCGSWKLWLQPGGGQDRFKPQWPQDGPSRRRAGGGAWCRRTGGRGAELKGGRLTGWRRGRRWPTITTQTRPDVLTTRATSPCLKRVKGGPGVGTKGKDHGGPRLLPE